MLHSALGGVSVSSSSKTGNEERSRRALKNVTLGITCRNALFVDEALQRTASVSAAACCSVLHLKPRLELRWRLLAVRCCSQ
jgi:hypothetical protein